MGKGAGESGENGELTEGNNAERDGSVRRDDVRRVAAPMAVLQCAFERAREQNGRGMRRGSAARTRALLKMAEAWGVGGIVGAGRGSGGCCVRERRERLQEVEDDKRTRERKEGERWISSFFLNKFLKLLSNGI